MIATRPFVDRPVGEVPVADAFAARAAEQLGLALPQRMRVGMNALYDCGDVVLRVGRTSAPAAEALALAARLRALGIPVPEPASGDAIEGDGLAATAWLRIETVDAPTDWTAVGAVVRRVHGLALSDLPPGYPVPSPVTFPWWDFDSLRDEVDDLVDQAAMSGLDAAIERHRDWVVRADTDAVVCHGDVHPGNVVMSPDGPVLLDWDLLCHAHPAWDHAMLLTLAERWGGDPTVYPSFVAGYGTSFEGGGAGVAFATLRNVAATLMRVRAGRTDATAHDEAARRLAYWRGEPGAPAWRAQ